MALICRRFGRSRKEILRCGCNVAVGWAGRDAVQDHSHGSVEAGGL